MTKRLGILLLLLFAGFTVNAQDDLLPAEELADENGQFIEVNGAKLYYVEAGSVDDPVVLLLHGFGGSTVTWVETMPALVNAGYRAIAYDRPPFGLSDKSPDINYSEAAQIDYAIAFLDALDIETTVLVGHSQGGGVTAQIAEAHPERVDAMVLVSAAVDGVSERASRTSDELFSVGGSGLEGTFALLESIDPESRIAQALLQQFLTPEQFADILASAYFNAEDATPERRARYARPLQVAGWPAGFLAYLVDVEQRTPVNLDALDAFGLPTLILWGEEDNWVPLTDGKWLNEVLTGSQIVTYPEVGHMPMEETVEQFNADLIAFLNELG